MATLIQIRDKANAKLQTFWTVLQTKQNEYFAKHGKYFQLLPTTRVVNGADTTFSKLTPSDEKNVSDVSFVFNEPVPFSISIDEWVGDKGATGYSVTACIELLDGRKFIRTRHSDGTDTNWSEVIKVNL